MLKIFQGTYQDKQESVVGSTFKHEKPNAWLIFNPKMTQLIGYNMFTNELKKKKKYWLQYNANDTIHSLENPNTGLILNPKMTQPMKSKYIYLFGTTKSRYINYKAEPIIRTEVMSLVIEITGY